MEQAIFRKITPKELSRRVPKQDGTVELNINCAEGIYIVKNPTNPDPKVYKAWDAMKGVEVILQPGQQWAYRKDEWQMVSQALVVNEGIFKLK